MIERIDKELLSAFGQSLAKGKKYRDYLIRDYPALKGAYTGKFLQPHILHACTDFVIAQKLSNKPYARVTEKWNGRNYYFLQIETETFYMTTSYAAEDAAVPREAHFRCTRAMSNQQTLFQEFEERLPKDKPYLILVHGLIERKERGEMIYEELFGGIGMPCADAPTRWNEFFPLTEYIDIAKTPEETIDEADPGFLKLKRHLTGEIDNNDSA